jgi:multiple sugar transport system substrate-binding protein
MKKKFFIIIILFSLFLTSGFGCKLVDKEVKKAMEPITINYWRVWDGPDAFDEIIANYKQLHPFVNINYRKFRYSDYEKEIINALAEDKGPDIFSIHNTWVRKYQTKIEPMPDSITMAYPVVKGTLKKETIPELRTTKSTTLKEIKNNFVEAVYDDVVIKVKNEKSGSFEERVFALPLALDTLAMFYNKDLLNNAGLPEPPSFWNKDFQQNVKKLTKQNVQGQIIQAGAALGGSANIERASDILSILMMQNGAEMADKGGSILFNRIPPALAEQKYNPGLEALLFYADFANPAKEVYCWNKDMNNSLKLFSEGKLALMFGYSYHLPTIISQAPKLNFGIAKLPQIEGNSSVNFANYWVETVSDKSKHKSEAWDFIQFATKAEQAKSYLAKTKKPTALRSLIAGQLDDLEVGVFASQVLTAKSWYKGYDSAAMEKIMEEIIDNVASGQMAVDGAINLGVQKAQQTMRAPNLNNE